MNLIHAERINHPPADLFVISVTDALQGVTACLSDVVGIVPAFIGVVCLDAHPDLTPVFAQFVPLDVGVVLAQSGVYVVAHALHVCPFRALGVFRFPAGSSAYWPTGDGDGEGHGTSIPFPSSSCRSARIWL